MKCHKIDMEKRSTVLMIAIGTTGGRIAEVWKMTAKKLAVGFCLACGAALSVVADEIPFWGDAEPPTNRPCASAHTVALVSGFESRICHEADLALVNFDSRPRGATIVIR